MYFRWLSINFLPIIPVVVDSNVWIVSPSIHFALRVIFVCLGCVVVLIGWRRRYGNFFRWLFLGEPVRDALEVVTLIDQGQVNEEAIYNVILDLLYGILSLL